MLAEFGLGRMKKEKKRFLTKGKLGGNKELVSDGTWSILPSIKGTSQVLPAKEKAGIWDG